MYIDNNGDRYGILTESGIDFGDGNILKDGLILEIARESKKFLEENNYNAFSRLIADKSKELNDKEYFTLMNIRILNSEKDICDELFDGYHARVPSKEECPELWI